MNETTGRLLNSLSWPAQTQGQLLHVVEEPLVGEVPPWLEDMARRSTAKPMARALVKEHDAEMRKRRNPCLT